MPYFPDIGSDTVYWGNDTLLTAVRLLALGQLVQGNQGELLARKLESELGLTRFLGFNSGRNALLFALRLLMKVQPSRTKVLLPCYLCGGLLDPVIKAGLQPIFVEVGKDLNISPSHLGLKLADDVLAVVIPHTYGYPARIAECLRLTKAHDPDIVVIDDAASALGLDLGGVKAGAHGDLGLFSFNQAKMLVASQGGGLAVNNPGLWPDFSGAYGVIPALPTKQKLREFLTFFWSFKHRRYSERLNYGIERLAGLQLSPRMNPNPARLANLDATLLMSQWNTMPVLHAARSEIIRYYQQALAGLEEVEFPQPRAADFHVSRCYIRIKGEKVVRGKKGGYDAKMPLAVKLAEIGIGTQYGYGPYYLSHCGAHEFADTHDYLSGLLGLPVNTTLPLSSYRKVVEAIKSHFVKDG